MRRIGFIFSPLVAFALGVWVAESGHELNPAAHIPVSATKSAGGVREATAHPLNPGSVSALEQRLTRLLSTLQDAPLSLKACAERAEILEEVRADEIAELIERLRKLPPRGNPLLSAAVERWFDLDPAAAQRWSEMRQNREVGRKVWVTKDPEGALAFAIRDGSPADWSIVQPALATLDGDDFPALCRRLAALPESPARNTVLRERLTYLARSAKAADALAFFATLPPGELRDELLPQVVGGMANIDPRGALAFLERQPDSPRKREALESVLISLVSRDPVEALARVETIFASLPVGITGNAFLNEFSDAFARKDLAAARAWIESLPAEMGQDPLIAVGRAWAKTEPVAALEWAMAHGVDVARNLYDRGNRSPGGVLQTAMLTRPEETFQWVSNFPPGPERDRLIERAFHERLDNVRSEQLFNDSNEILFDLFEELPPDAQPRAARDLGSKRAERESFTDLDAWAAHFPAGPAQDAAIAGALQRLADSNFARAETIIEAITNQHQLDVAVSGLANGMVRRDPASAAARAIEIGDATIRFDTLDRIIPQWLRTNGAAARAWLDSASVVPRDWRVAWEVEVR